MQRIISSLALVCLLSGSTVALSHPTRAVAQDEPTTTPLGEEVDAVAVLQADTEPSTSRETVIPLWWLGAFGGVVLLSFGAFYLLWKWGREVLVEQEDAQVTDKQKSDPAE